MIGRGGEELCISSLSWTGRRSSQPLDVYSAPELIQAITAHWTRDGEPQMAFSSEGGVAETFRLGMGGGRVPGKAERLPLLHPYLPSLSPDGRWFVFASHQDSTGVSSLWLADSHGLHSRKIADGYDESRWAPDGRHIAFHGGYGKMRAAQVYVMDLDPDAEIRKPVEAPGPPVRQVIERGPDWSPDGKYLYATRPGAPPRIVRFPVAGGEVEDLFDGDYPRINRSQRRIYYGRGSGQPAPPHALQSSMPATD